MNDGLPTIEIIQSTSWWALLISAFGGAILTLLGSWFFDWCKRPKLTICFEESVINKPHIRDIFIDHEGYTRTNRRKILMLNVYNTGKKTSTNCEGKIVAFREDTTEHFRQILHWTRRDPEVYNTLDQIYSTTNINRSDLEKLDVLKLDYSPEETRPLPGLCIESISPKPIKFERNVVYYITVDVYSSNTSVKPFVFKLFWDGTIEGFSESIVKKNKLPRGIKHEY